MHGIFGYSLMDFHGEIAANRQAVFLHAPYWRQRSFVEEGISDAQRDTLLNAIRKAWSDVSRDIALPG